MLILSPGRILLLFATVLLNPTVAAAQLAAAAGPRIIDTGRLDQKQPNATSAPVPAGAAQPPRPTIDPNHRLTVRAFVVTGNTSLNRAAIDAAWHDLQGRSIRIADVYAVADRISGMLKQASLALYEVQVTDTGAADGTPKIRIIEGYVGHVTISGDTKGADLSLIGAHAARLVADRPLHQPTLEREILLINDIPGVTTSSRFEPIPGSQGGVQLLLDLKRKSVVPGFGIINQGNPILSQLQGNVSIAANSLLHEGDRTSGVFGFPFTWTRYQYYGLSHQEPIGRDGTTVTITGGDLVTRPAGFTNAGNATLLSVSLNHPLIRGVDQNLFVIASLDALNSNNAVLGSTTTDERTRSLRFGLLWSYKDRWDGQDESSIVASEGLNIFGARRGTIAAGGPSFTKITLHLGREQQLPLMFLVRVKAAGQAAGNSLPLSEQFTYGGTDVGQAFNAGAMTGDQGFTLAAELAWHPTFKSIPELVAGSELFVGIDWGKVWNRNTLALPASNVGASAVVGLRLQIAKKVAFTVAVAKPLITPLQAGGGSGWRFVFGITGSF